MSLTNYPGSQELKPRGRRSFGVRTRLLNQVFSNPSAEFTTKEIVPVIASFGGPSSRQGCMFIISKWENAGLIRWSEGYWVLNGPSSSEGGNHVSE